MKFRATPISAIPSFSTKVFLILTLLSSSLFAFELPKTAKDKESILSAIPNELKVDQANFPSLQDKEFLAVFFSPRIVKSRQKTKKYEFPAEMAAYEKHNDEFKLAWQGETPFTDELCQYRCEASIVSSKDGFVMKERDLSDEGTTITYRFRWEKKDFRLIGKTVSATPRGSVTSTRGEELSGRWLCSVDINLLNGDKISKNEKKDPHSVKSKIPESKRQAQFLKKDSLKMSSDELGECE